jgi:DNA-binding MarR family transcriptional regulator
MDDRAVRLFRAQIKLLQRRLRYESPAVQGLSRSALQVLAVVARVADGAQPRQVGEQLQMTSSNVAAALRELEAAEFIRRERDPEDARRVEVFVTENGHALLANLRGEKDTWLGQAVEAVLTEQEQRTLIEAGELLERLTRYESPSSITPPRSGGAQDREASSSVASDTPATPGMPSKPSESTTR